MLVLDTSAILRTDLDFSEGNYLITNAVYDEIREDNARLAVKAAMRNHSMRIVDPDEISLKKVISAAKSTGDLDRLSETDLGILALALEKKIPLRSDDYNIQNVASFLKIPFKKTTADGIKRELKWSFVCSGCKKNFPEKRQTCPICGSSVNRRSRRA